MLWKILLAHYYSSRKNLLEPLFFLMSLWKKIAIALTVATLLYGSQIAMYTNNWNRFLEHWQFVDGLSMVLGIILLAALFFVAQQLVALLNWSWLNRVVQHF